MLRLPGNVGTIGENFLGSSLGARQHKEIFDMFEFVSINK